MRAQEYFLTGTHRCCGVILDSSEIGSQRAKERVLALWQPDATLSVLPDGRWLLLLAVEADLNDHDAGGTLVVKESEGLLTAPQMQPERGDINYWWHGESCHCGIQTLDRLDPSEWLSFSVQPQVLDAVCRAAPLASEPAVAAPEPDLRSIAGVSSLSDAAKKFASDVRSDSQASGPLRRRSRTQAGRGNGVQTRRRSGALSDLILRSPLKHEIGRRHARYLERLNKQFLTGDLGEALRNAIPIGGLGAQGATLRLPQRRQSLQLTGGHTGGRSVMLGPTINQHLQAMYRKAATDLEKAGRIDEAAFVYAELLNSPSECVAMLERHRRYEMAAKLSENRELDAALTVRLWWLSGDSDRAFRLARRTHSYAAVLKFFEDSDPHAAHQFRLMWVGELERSGSLHGAVSVGWSDLEIRPLLVNAIRRGHEADDEWSLGMQAFGVILQPSSERRAAFKSALRDPATSQQSLRFMAESLSQAVSADAVVDRELCTAAVRALAALPKTSDKSFGSAYRTIQKRADPIVVADLPRAPNSKAQNGLVAIPTRPPGVSEIYDVVPLGKGRSLVALGELGVRLINATGSVAAQWPTPCHHVVPADHGRSALLITARDASLDVSVLDLVTRKIRYYGTFLCGLWATTFDGATWAAVDDRGIAFYDVLADQPKIAWRELKPGSTCHALQRSSESLAAYVSIPPDPHHPQGRQEMWRWVLPSLRLNTRKQLRAEDQAVALHLLSDATSIWQFDGPAPRDPVIHTVDGAETLEPLGVCGAVRSSGDMVAFQGDDGTIKVTGVSTNGVVAQWPGIEEQWSFRTHGSKIALWTTSGNVALVDLNDGRSLNQFSVS